MSNRQTVIDIKLVKFFRNMSQAINYMINHINYY